VDLNTTYIKEGSLECGASSAKSPHHEILKKTRDIDMNLPSEENTGTNFSFIFSCYYVKPHFVLEIICLFVVQIYYCMSYY
jgi:hypothetical protein